MKQKLLELGKVVNTHGIRGEIKVQPWCDSPDIFDDLDYFYIDGEKFEIEQNRLHKNCEIIKLGGIDNMDRAVRLKNKIITIEREELGELPEGSHYICDLLGLLVKTRDGRELGIIEDVLKTGSNDVYVLKSEHKTPVLIPVIDQVVKEINIADGYVLVELLKGLIDDED